MRVLVAGASGAIGVPLLRRLRDAGHDVVGVHRSPAGGERIRAAGAEAVRVDVLDRGALLDALAGARFDAVVSELTALRKPPAAHRDMTTTNRLRIEGTRNLLEAAERTGARRFVTQSMVFGYGYGDFGGRVLSETDPFAPPGRGRFERHLAAMRSNEQQVLGSAHVEGVALRYGLFYGPGPAADALVQGLRRRRLPVFSGAGVLPWVYVDDAAAATVAALERGRPGAAYNVADDEPVGFSTMVAQMAAAVGAPAPRVLPRWLTLGTPYARAIVVGGLRVDTARAKEHLGWSPQMPTYREGVAALEEHYRKGPDLVSR